MSKGRRPNRINKSDYCRVLVTETLPHETPIIFSNDDLYERVINIEQADPIQRKLFEALMFTEPSKIHSSIPFLYKVRKNSHEFRRLALLHPRSQWKIKLFYEKYEHLILHYCAISPASIRAPQKIAGSFFFKNSSENLNQYKNDSISLLTLDSITKHSSTFFSYRGHDRLYKFFESRDYFELEKQFGFMMTLDVSKCFDSIYTHSMSWALKDKNFTKKHVGVNASFAQKFDELMRHANHGETNGIVIGPEISRIFAEILFQEIDCRAIKRIKGKLGVSFEFGENYSFRRYVDDVFIFSKTADDAQVIYKIYSDVLSLFNLHANSTKSVEMARPFATNKSRLIQVTSLEVNNFITKLFDSTKKLTVLVPKQIRSVWKLTRSFIESIKTICASNQVNYDEVATFLIAVLTERVKKMVAIKIIDAPDKNQGRYRDAILVILDVLYFLYGISPSVPASYKFCASVILIHRFTKLHFPALESTVSQRIYELSETLFAEAKLNDGDTIENLVSLEMLNVMLAIRELGANYLLPEATLNGLFSGEARNSYFSIVSCLFYIKDDLSYDGLRQKILAAADTKLADVTDISMNSEKAYLFLDLLSCPYVSDQKKSEWTKRACVALQLQSPNSTEMSAFLNPTTNACMHVNWKNVDLLNALEKKELKRAYS